MFSPDLLDLVLDARKTKTSCSLDLLLQHAQQIRWALDVGIVDIKRKIPPVATVCSSRLSSEVRSKAEAERASGQNTRRVEPARSVRGQHRLNVIRVPRPFTDRPGTPAKRQAGRR